MKATLLTIASARNEAMRFAQNVAKTSPAAMYPSASVSMACCIRVASSITCDAAEQAARKRPRVRLAIPDELHGFLATRRAWPFRNRDRAGRYWQRRLNVFV